MLAGLNQSNAYVQVTVDLLEAHLKPVPCKTKTKSKPWDGKIVEITAAICALFNSSYGGVLRLRFDKRCATIKATEPKMIDDMVRRIEQSLLDFVGVAIVSEAFQLQDSSEDIGGLDFVVKPVHRFCTVEYHLYLPTDYQTSPIAFGDSLSMVASLLEPEGGILEATFKEHCKDFRYKQKVPGGLREAHTVQFKLLKDDSTSNFTLADRMTNKSNKLVNCVSAFANYDGGNIYFGVDDETYRVEGQVANERERDKIKRKISNLLSKMVWPHKQHKLFWKVVFQEIERSPGHDEVPKDTFVIVLSVAKCPGGVFVQEPESYELKNGEVIRVPLPEWKDKIRAEKSKDDDYSLNYKASERCCAMVPVNVYKGIGVKEWNSQRQEEEYMEVTQFMENLRNNGNWADIDRFAARVLTTQNGNADLKLAVTFQCTAAAYRQNKYQEAYKFLGSYHDLVRLAKNPAIFEVQELYSWSAIKRSERNYQESYRYTYDALQKMQFIVPGWITAWFLCNAASLLTILASEEGDPRRKNKLVSEAVLYYRGALDHAQSLTAYKKAEANLRHRVHINLAMVYLASSPNITSMNYNQTISPQFLRSAQASLRAAEDFEGSPMTGFNKFYFLLAKSDLFLRHFQQNPQENHEHLKEAIQYAKDARKVAIDNDFAEVLHYAESRITLLESISIEEQTPTESVDALLSSMNL